MIPGCTGVKRTVPYLGMADCAWGVRMYPEERRLGVEASFKASHFRECRTVAGELTGEFYFFLHPASIRHMHGARYCSRNLGCNRDRTDLGSLWSFSSSRAMR